MSTKTVKVDNETFSKDSDFYNANKDDFKDIKGGSSSESFDFAQDVDIIDSEEEQQFDYQQQQTNEDSNQQEQQEEELLESENIPDELLDDESDEQDEQSEDYYIDESDENQIDDDGDTEDVDSDILLESKDKINLKDISKLDVWNLIDSYFRDTKYYKSQHQLNSFNEFIKSKVNGIQNIIENNNEPYILYKEPLSGDSNRFRYEIKIYFGKKISEKTGEIDKDQKDNIYLSMPTIYNEKTDKMEYMYPNNARLKGLTYACNIFCNISIVYNDIISKTSKIKFFSRVNIGKIPIMLHSSMCLLNGLDKKKIKRCWRMSI